MPSYVVLLRGVNVGGRQPIAMAKLRTLLEHLGYADVRTYLQSGNAVIAAPKRSTSSLAKEVEQAIKDDFGATVTVMVRTARELEQVIVAKPAGADASDPKKLHVAFLGAKPAADAVRATEVPAGDSGRFWVVGRELYLYLPDGQARTKLSGAYFERKLGVAATARNWRTVTTLAEMAAGV
jgi:uncharacterized protein (DUF1697 family)